MIALLGSVLAASLLGSPHCAAMCGGFVCFYAGQPGARREALAHAAYNGGRLLSYLALGTIAGALGAGLDRLGGAAGFTRAAAVIAGAMMVAWGGASLLRALGARVPELVAPAFARARLTAALRAVHAQPPAVRALTVGLLTTLLPCGFLYAFVAVAAATGSPWRGALAMAAFWAGTLPVMASLGLIARRAFGPLERRLPAITASVLLLLGLLTLAGKMTPRAAHDHMHGMHGMTHGDR